jgi:predicted neuraminidase
MFHCHYNNYSYVLGKPNLVAFFRDRNVKHIYRSESADDGNSWSKPSKTTLPNNSGIHLKKKKRRFYRFHQHCLLIINCGFIVIQLV